MNDDILILFATTTGNAETCAGHVHTKISGMGRPVRLVNMRDYEAAELKKESTVLVVVSTWGDGEPPDDALPFYEQLGKLEADSLSHLSYSIFGLGDTAYEQFCGCAKNTDKLFKDFGASHLIERVEVDGDYDDQLQTWIEQLHPVLSSAQTSTSL